MTRQATTNELASQVTAMHRKLDELVAAVQALTARIEGSRAEPAQAVTEDGHVVFLPGTGRFGSTCAPEPEGETVDQDRGVELARAAREALRGEQ